MTAGLDNIESAPVRSGYLEYWIDPYPASPQAIAAREAGVVPISETIAHLEARIERIREKLAAYERGE